MFSIGDFARHGRVSVRMLRHYDRLGLLRPAQVDPSTGYRSYDATQLSRLNRIVALKELGFTLEQVQSIIDDAVSAEQLRGMLRLRQAELADRIAADLARLSQVEARLLLIESEGAMSTADIQIKRIPGVRVAELTGTATSFEPESIGPVIQPLYPELLAAVERAGLAPAGPTIAYYEDAADGGVLVHAAVPVNAEPSAEHDFTIVDLPPIEQAATIVHQGSMDAVIPTVQALARWIEAGGYRSTGYNREYYPHYGDGDPATWVTELQEPVVPVREHAGT
ncbi:MerR family transcriptional regulator [Amycolatopsis cihanbeyliensis]|uniref:DNA-binding transcriptional MerR regulator n=1 Tax=Amycolatopsis cihanbeyliensis TaxID=1128664 RepID=A0A542DK63_AMYCI|nr:MerR family transcriptional regulator [Amycolatopsis cihanbeyliensis]TQJ03487.1 DNA-binding transcriptional MerR regulator [Amycolatopsis cihanbeyliensis]